MLIVIFEYIHKVTRFTRFSNNIFTCSFELSMRFSIIAFAGIVCAFQGCKDEEKPPMLPRVDGLHQVGGAGAIPDGRFNGKTGMRGAGPNISLNPANIADMIPALAANPSVSAEIKAMIPELLAVLQQVNVERLTMLGQAAVAGAMMGNANAVRALLESKDWRLVQPLVQRMLKHLLNDKEIVASIKSGIDAQSRNQIRFVFQGLKQQKEIFGLIVAVVGRENFNRIENLLTNP
jgi:hypothetical protein